ncbi:hypothetical protein GCM10015535_39610 [Streptomyces gelaticus]|uniref:Uncharacterized protein n=1 Tax=Streptomyces gelaticus TaxID=285446 RepID=A0ABQ2W0T2_9ACTN|nr:hypothetical protein [Streptomyces gelaticus]GGV88355.1 hypothetical protein GCM10015535_39610 [Streptomyces gelaticus]
MTPHSLAFYMDVIRSGTVLGAKPTDSPDQVTAILGSDFAENSFDDQSMWRDYGMAEFFWGRKSRDHPWVGHHFTLQVHRLSSLGGSIVNRVIRERYGRFDRHLRFDKLERLLAKRGVRMEDVPDSNAPAYTLHWQPVSQVSVLACGAHERGKHRRGGERIGDVNAVSSSMSAEQVAWYRARYGRQNI